MENHVKIPEGYTIEKWANVVFWGNHTDYLVSIDEIRNFLTEFQKYIEITNIHLDNGRIKAANEFELERMKNSFQYTHCTILKESTIISSYILLERAIGSYCDTFMKYSSTLIKLSDLKGDILERFKKYSIKVMDLNFDFESELWQNILGLHEIRNCLIHNSGIVEGYNKRKTIEQFMSKNNSFGLFNNYSIEIEFAGCYAAIGYVEDFLDNLVRLAFEKFPGEYK